MSAVGFATVADAEDDDPQFLWAKLIDDSIVTEAEGTKTGELPLQGFPGQRASGNRCQRGL